MAANVREVGWWDVVQLRDELLTRLRSADRHAASDTCVAAVESGISLAELVDRGLAPAMTQVGMLWQTGAWSIADEHIATGSAELALSAAAAATRRAHSRGDLVIASVAGDWHSLPARMVAEVLDNEDWNVRFLGASCPTAQLLEVVHDIRPTAVLLGCSLATALPALADAIERLHRQDVPVIVGGRALGGSPSRAAALGADGWAADAAGAAALLDLPVSAQPPSRPDRLAAHQVRTFLISDWVNRAVAQLPECVPLVASYPQRPVGAAKSHMRQLLRTASVADFLDDPTVLFEQCEWLAGLLRAHHVPARALPVALQALVTVEPPISLARDLRPLLLQTLSILAQRLTATDVEMDRILTR